MADREWRRSDATGNWHLYDRGGERVGEASAPSGAETRWTWRTACGHGVEGVAPSEHVAKRAVELLLFGRMPMYRTDPPAARVDWRSRALGVVIGALLLTIVVMVAMWVRWEVYETSSGTFACSPRLLGRHCYPCPTTDEMDARVQCDAAGFPKGGGR